MSGNPPSDSSHLDEGLDSNTKGGNKLWWSTKGKSADSMKGYKGKTGCKGKTGKGEIDTGDAKGSAWDDGVKGSKGKSGHAGLGKTGDGVKGSKGKTGDTPETVKGAGKTGDGGVKGSKSKTKRCTKCQGHGQNWR